MAKSRSQILSEGDDRTIVAPLRDEQTDLGTTQPYLRIVNPRDKGSHYPITGQGLLLGRGVDVDVFISDAQVSREHCHIRIDNGVVTLTDLNSTNGTLVDGQLVRSAVITPSSRIKIGEFILRLEYRAPFELKAENQIIKASRTDELTGVSNRRWFYSEAAELIKRSLKSNAPASVVMIDIDRFKGVNDRFGHAAGDEVIRHVCKILQREKRTPDLLARFGGEEFVMFLPRTGEADAIRFCERLRQRVNERPCCFESTSVTTQVSIGIYAAAATEITSLENAIGLADAAMYRAKQAGRNRVST